MAVVDWPDQLSAITQTSWFLASDSVSPGVGLDGRRQVIFRENRRWVGSVTVSAIWREKVPLLQTTVDQLQGSAGILRFPVCNLYTLRYRGDTSQFYTEAGVSSAGVSAGHLDYSDGTNFSDGTGFALPSTDEPTVRRAASAGASIIWLDGYMGRNIGVGSYFSINDFLYRVQSNTDGYIAINPPLRAAVAAGDAVKVSYPTIKVRLAADDEARLVVDHDRWGRPLSFNVVEAFQR